MTRWVSKERGVRGEDEKEVSERGVLRWRLE